MSKLFNLGRQFRQTVNRTVVFQVKTESYRRMYLAVDPVIVFKKLESTCTHPSNIQQSTSVGVQHTLDRPEQLRSSLSICSLENASVDQRPNQFSNSSYIDGAAIKRLKQMDWIDLIEHIAKLRLEAGVISRASSFDEIFEFMLQDQKDQIMEIVNSKISKGNEKIQPEVWLHYVNVFAHCKDLDEAMVEIYGVASVQADYGKSDIIELFDTIQLPTMVLKQIVTLVRNHKQASEACFLLNNHIAVLDAKDLFYLHGELNEIVINRIQALYLTGSLTDISCRICEYAIQSANGRAIAQEILAQQLKYLINHPTGYIRAHAARLLRWSRENLTSHQTDILRMQLLGYTPNESNRSWEEIDWKTTPTKLFLNPSTARYIIRNFCDNERDGIGMELALKAAMDAAVHYEDLTFASDLIKLSEVLLNAERIDKRFPLDPSFIRTLKMIGQDSQAWHLIKIVFHAEKSRGRSPDVRYWAIVLGTMAMDETISPLYAMRKLSIADDDGKAYMKDFEMVPSELLHDVRLYNQLIQKIRLRQDQDNLKYIQMIWNAMLQRGVQPDQNCLTEYCIALIKSDRSLDVFDLLDEWLIKVVPANTELFYRIMKWMMERGDLKNVHSLFCQLSSKWQIQPGPRLLALLLSAAEQASKLQKENGQMNGHPLIAKFLYQKASTDIEHQTIWDGLPAALCARQIFRKTLFEQYPDLINIPGPMEWGTMNALWRGEMHLRNLEGWMKDTLDMSVIFNNMEKIERKSNSKSSNENDFEPITFQCTQDLFHSYLRLLPHVEDVNLSISDRKHSKIRWDERLFVLSWMRSLDIVPFKETLYLICVYLHDIIPPMLEESRSFNGQENRYDSLAMQSAAGPLHDYLCDWLGSSQVPRNKDIANFIRNSHSM